MDPHVGQSQLWTALQPKQGENVPNMMSNVGWMQYWHVYHSQQLAHQHQPHHQLQWEEALLASAAN